MILYFLLLFLLIFAGILIYYIIKFARIIFILEESLEEIIEVHERSIESMNKFMEMPMFYDSPDVGPVLQEVLEDVKLCRAATLEVTEKFLQFSKNKFVKTIKEEE